MRLSDPVSSDLLKKVNAIIEDATYQENSFIFNHELLRRYGPGSKQSFIYVPKSKKDYQREEVLIPEEKEIKCNKSRARELIEDLKSSGDIIKNIINIFTSRVESEEGIDNENFHLAKYGINAMISKLLLSFCLGVEDPGCKLNFFVR